MKQKSSQMRFAPWPVVQAALALALSGLLLARPQAAAQGFAAGLKLCGGSLLPALFPLFVVCGLLGPLAPALGWPLRPLMRLCGIRSPRASAVLVLGCMLCLLAAAAPFADARNSGVATSFYNVENWDGESRITFTQHISDWQNDSAAQYGALAHSLLNGRLDLQRDPPAAMAEMQNPYDTAARQSAAPDALWDVAYYQGRYYVYFGIVPCLLFQLPFELLTGVPDLPPSLAMIVMAWLLILAVFGLVRQAAQRWFPSASAAACLLAAAGIAGGSQVYYLLLRPSVYEYAILCGAAFVLLALWQWLCAANTPVQHHGKIMLHMALGSLCMALVAGCRPQMELFAVLCLPIFWPQYIRQKRLRSKQGITEAIAFVLPVILVALGLMAYNAARFGSPFDFGANYNLTSNDMTHRGFRIGRLAPALFTYFLSLPVVQAVFPYLAGTKMQTNFMGMTITEVFYGGALVSLPLLWAFAALPLLRRRMARQKDLRAMVLLPVLLAMVPGAWVPTRWSDFGFWAALGKSAAARVDAWFALPPQHKDIAVKWLLLEQGALCLAGCLFALRRPPAPRNEKAVEA